MENQRGLKFILVFTHFFSDTGLVLIAGFLMLASFAMFAFPKRLPTARPTPRIHKADAKHPSIRGKIWAFPGR